MTRLRQIDPGEILMHLMVLLLVVVTLLMLFVAIWYIIHPQPVPPSAFSADVRAVVEQCAESNTSASASHINGVTVSSKSVNADALLRCLYSNGVTINFHGDPVEMGGGE